MWLGVGAAFKKAKELDAGNPAVLKEMYEHWPFFRVTMDLLEMVFAKADPRVSALYERRLAPPELHEFGQELSRKFEESRAAVLEVS